MEKIVSKLSYAALILFACMVTASVFLLAPRTSAEALLLGDANQDGVIDISDGVLISRFIAENADAAISFENADADRNQVIDLQDVILVLKHITRNINLMSPAYYTTTITSTTTTVTTTTTTTAVFVADNRKLPLGVPTSALEMQSDDEFTVSCSSRGRNYDITYSVYLTQSPNLTIALSSGGRIMGYYQICSACTEPDGYRKAEYWDSFKNNAMYAALIYDPSISPSFMYAADLTDLSAFSKLSFYITNGLRKLNGKSMLQWDAALAEAALAHSKDMASTDTMSHTGSDGTSAVQRLKRAGAVFSSYGENVCAGDSTAFDAMDLWYNSGGHRSNILSMEYEYNSIGVGFAYTAKSVYHFFGTQDYIG
ncbi:MAG: CAP domain-containing protein [Oscillospiraceae bacterium]|nr:CAP domain-containing protein [Oscillospiraceae bacterium]